jgi:hypothetical protein
MTELLACHRKPHSLQIVNSGATEHQAVGGVRVAGSITEGRHFRGDASGDAAWWNLGTMTSRFAPVSQRRRRRMLESAASESSESACEP